ncbi:dUTP diphosphatase [Neochlamydia sp. S13]|jgi:dUTP pyrophosphatase|uniref:dUTP diphosphatase n=1 Tax=Neochlamydia sp. S13 TaxID=1353976 RepID=UPI0005A66252|nr:dUTP diphosphatase [Neochlamydia sp. S13]BBI17687.1 deoxyuridine 5`-triphosphatenucleotidohydrolase [Neochlamydia sp. S13]
MNPALSVEVLVLSPDVSCLPQYASSGAAGADVRAYLKEPLVLAAGESCLIPTGLRMAIPQGYEIQVRPRSGLALKNQVTVLNTPGTIDADYRGEIGIILINHGKQDFIVTPGMRIAQFVLAPVTVGNFILSEKLTDTARGDGGFGHTGIH